MIDLDPGDDSNMLTDFWVFFPQGVDEIIINASWNEDNVFDPKSATVSIAFSPDYDIAPLKEEATMHILETNPEPANQLFARISSNLHENNRVRSDLIITRTGDLDSGLVVPLGWGGTATPELDYRTLDGFSIPSSVELLPGQSEVRVPLWAINDAEYEDSAEFILLTVGDVPGITVSQGRALLK